MTPFWTIAALAALAWSHPAHAADPQILTSTDPLLIMKPLALPGDKTASYTVGIGSGAHRNASDPPDVVWTVGDRGPNATCSQARELWGAEVAANCSKLKSGRVYATPDYVPSIYKVQLDRTAGTFRVLEVIPLKTRSGKLISGLLNPQTRATRDTGMDLAGATLPYDADNLDLEGIVHLSDGTFWIGEEMGPSVAHVSADGRILERFVPADAADDYRNAEAKIIATLPAILSRREGNRGIETMAISPDEKFLYFMMQNALANPDSKTYQQARNLRVFKMERASGVLVGEYVYQLDDPRTFGLDPSEKQNDPRVSELTALGPDRLLVLERTEATTKLYEIMLAGATNILGSKWDDSAIRPTLEQENDAAKVSIVTLQKTLRFDTARDLKSAPVKIEGMAILGDGALMLINDNDFGITGETTRVVIIKDRVQADRAVYMN